MLNRIISKVIVVRIAVVFITIYTRRRQYIPLILHVVWMSTNIIFLLLLVFLNNHVIFSNSLKQQQWGEISVPLYSCFSKEGEYYVNVSIGSPPKTFLLQLDTGSSDLGVPKWGCTSCTRHANKRYVPSKSKTSNAENCSVPFLNCPVCHDNICSYSIAYADDSGYSAEIYTDAVQFAGSSKSTKVFNSYVGAIYEDHLHDPTEPQNLDGIIGVAYPSVSATGSTLTIIDNLYKSGIIESNVFSICMNKNKGGMLYLGSSNALKKISTVDSNDEYSNIIQWTPLIKETYYVVKLIDVRINNVSIGVDPSVYNRGDAIVDSGSTSVSYFFTISYIL